MTKPRRTRNRPLNYHPTSHTSKQVWLKRKRGFQQILFNLSTVVLAFLVFGFILSAFSSRSGVQMTMTSRDLAERSRLLSAPATDFDITSDYANQDERVVLEVLNGIGVAGLAGRYTSFLRDEGYDVVRFTNAQRNDYPRTLVINRGTNFDAALQVGASLGIDVKDVQNMTDLSLQLDVTVVLGQDYKTLTSYRSLMSGGK